MSSELKIQDMGTKKSDHPLKHTFLPALPMRMLVVAPSNGGKSNLLKYASCVLRLGIVTISQMPRRVH